MNAVIPQFEGEYFIDSKKLREAVALFYMVVAEEVEYLTKNRETSIFGVKAIQASRRIERILQKPYSKFVTHWLLHNRDVLLASSILVDEIAYFIVCYSRKYQLDTDLQDFVKSINADFNELGLQNQNHERFADDAGVIYDSIGELLKKLPGRLKKLADVLMEMLRLFSGNG